MLSPSAIAGLSLGVVAFVSIAIGSVLWLHRRRKAKQSTSDDDKEAAEQEQTTRARDLRQDRYRNCCASGHMQIKERFEEMKAKMTDKEGKICEEGKTCVIADGVIFEVVEQPQVQYDRSRRPSGLVMHPTTPS